MRLPFFLLLTCVSAACVLGADDAQTRMLHVLRVFTLPKADGEKLLLADLDDAAMYHQLMDSAKTNPSVLEKLIMVSADSDSDASVTLADELIYPTEFDPQQLPQQVVLGEGALLQAVQKMLEPSPEPPPSPAPPGPPKPGEPPKKAGEDKAPPNHPAPMKAPAPRHPVNNGLAFITAITPTAFEMRPVGDKLDIKSLQQPHELAGDTTMEYQCTRHGGFDQVNGEMLPHFSVRRVGTSIAWQRDKPIFAGTCSVPPRTGVTHETKETTLSLAFLTVITSTLLNPPLKPDDDTLHDYATTLEVISMPKPAANQLMTESLPERDVHARLQAEIKAGRARTECLLSGRATDGEKCLLEEGTEYRYPTEYDPPQIPQSIFLADEKLLADLRAGNQTGLGLAPPAPGSSTNAGFGLMTKATPTAFEMRKLGARLEFDLVRENNLFHLHDLTVNLTRLIGHRDYNGPRQPVFESQTIATQTTAQPGVPHLIGTLNRPINTGFKEGNQDDRVWFAFITLGR